MSMCFSYCEDIIGSKYSFTTSLSYSLIPAPILTSMPRENGMCYPSADFHQSDKIVNFSVNSWAAKNQGILSLKKYYVLPAPSI